MSLIEILLLGVVFCLIVLIKKFNTLLREIEKSIYVDNNGHMVETSKILININENIGQIKDFISEKK